MVTTTTDVTFQNSQTGPPGPLRSAVPPSRFSIQIRRQHSSSVRPADATSAPSRPSLSLPLIPVLAMTCDVCPPPDADTDADASATEAVTLSSTPSIDVESLIPQLLAGTSDEGQPAASHPETARTPALAIPARVTATALVRLARAWDETSLAPHDEGSVAVYLGGHLVGTICTSGIVEVSFPESIRQALLEQGLASTARYIAETGTVSLRMITAPDVRHGATLLHLAYLYRRIVQARSARTLAALQAEIAGADLPDAVRDPFLRILDRKRQGFRGS